MPNPPPPKKRYKNEDGEVITAPRNFLTTKPKLGRVGRGTSFGGVIPYTEDDYNVKKKIIRKEMMFHQEKVGERPPFSQQCKRLAFGTFNKPKDVIGSDLPPMPAPKHLKGAMSS